MTYSPADPDVSRSLFFLGLPALAFGGLLPALEVFVIKCEKISVCFSKKSNLLERSVSILLSKSPSLPFDDVVSLEEPFYGKIIKIINTLLQKHTKYHSDVSIKLK